MSMEYIRKTYKVPAKRGMRIKYTGDGIQKFGDIVGSKGCLLRVKFTTISDGQIHEEIVTIHPTWEIEYNPDGEELKQ